MLTCLLALSAVACGGTTEGSLIQLPFQAGGVQRPVAGPMTFVSATGWTVTLEEARIALGPFYFNVAPASTTSFRSGVVIIEVTHQIVVDPLDPQLMDVAGGADGQTGRAVSVEIGLLPPDPSQSAADRALLGTNQGYVRGEAVRGADQVPFEGFITLDESLVTPETPLPAVQRISGAAAKLDFTGQPETLTLRVDPSSWFDSVSFNVLTSGPLINGRYTWLSPSAFLSTLLPGVTQESGVYEFSLAPTPSAAR
jgi:hypothetical protein